MQRPSRPLGSRLAQVGVPAPAATAVPAPAHPVPAHPAPAPLAPFPRRPRGLRTGLVAFVLLFVAMGAWSVATPLGGSPDEPAQLIRAASVVRGQLVGRPLPGATRAQGSIAVVRVPEVFASLANDVSCFYVNPWAPAGCQAPLVPSPQDQPVETYVGRYPPFYYAVVGLPTLVWVSPGGIYGARLASAALSAAMLALAVVSLTRCRGRPMVVAGFSLAVTPMVLYLGGVVNPSGFELASAVAAFCGALALARLPLEEVGPAALAGFGAPALALVLVRALAPVWALAALGMLVWLRPWAEVKVLVARAPTRAWLAVGALAGAFALAWDLLAGGLRLQPGEAVPAHAGAATVAHLALDRLHLIAVSSLGQFGWMDTPSPWGVVSTLALALGVLALLAFASGSRAARWLLVGTGVLWAGFCYVFVLAMVPTHGVVGQGRDFLGLAVGIPLVAGLGTRVARLPGFLQRRWRTLCGAFLAVVAICQSADFYETLRRFSVGISGPVDAFAHVRHGWQPPVAGPVLVAAFIASVSLGAVLLWRLAGAVPPARPRPRSTWAVP